MKDFLRAMGVLLAIVLGFVVGGLGSFFGMLVWDSFVLHDHDGQAGLGLFIAAFWVGLASAAIAAIFSVRWFRQKDMSNET